MEEMYDLFAQQTNQDQGSEQQLCGKGCGQANLWSCASVVVSKKVWDDDAKCGEEWQEVTWRQKNGLVTFLESRQHFTMLPNSQMMSSFFGWAWLSYTFHCAVLVGWVWSVVTVFDKTMTSIVPIHYIVENPKEICAQNRQILPRQSFNPWCSSVYVPSIFTWMLGTHINARLCLIITTSINWISKKQIEQLNSSQSKTS